MLVQPTFTVINSRNRIQKDIELLLDGAEIKYTSYRGGDDKHINDRKVPDFNTK